MNNNFDVYLQPIFESGTRNILGREVLYRWSEVSSPLRVRDIFAAKYIISNFNDVFKSVSGQTKYDKVFLNLLTSNINEFINTFNDIEFSNDLIIELDFSNEDFNEAQVLKDVKKLQGIPQVHLAIDDYGKYQLNDTFINSLNPKYIKIDIELIADISKDTSKQSQVAKIINLANSVQAEVIAEGVEKTEDEDYLLSIKGIQYIQGFLYQKPSHCQFNFNL